MAYPTEWNPREKSPVVCQRTLSLGPELFQQIPSEPKTPENTLIKSANNAQLKGITRPTDDRFRVPNFSQINWMKYNGDKFKVLHLGF